MTTYPSSSWDSYEATIRNIGERRPVDFKADSFLSEIGIVDDGGALTVAGQMYFHERFVRRDEDAATLIVQALLLNTLPALALCQRLYGVPRVDRTVVESVLRNVGLGDGLTDRNLGTLLAVLAKFGVVSYVKNRGEVAILHPPMETGQVPSTVLISRETPFSNVMWLTRVLRECSDYIYWLDKHFQAAGFEAIADAADGNRINEIRILSLKLPTNSSPRVLKAYQALKQELLARKIQLEWRFVDSTVVRDIHDRWIIGASSARNVPDVGTIMSGNKSEISASDSSVRLQTDFLKYWDDAVEAA